MGTVGWKAEVDCGTERREGGFGCFEEWSGEGGGHFGGGVQHAGTVAVMFGAQVGVTDRFTWVDGWHRGHSEMWTNMKNEYETGGHVKCFMLSNDFLLLHRCGC